MTTLSSLAAVAADDLWAVGYTAAIEGGELPLVQHWDGSSWTLVAGPDGGVENIGLTDVSATAADDVWAVGATAPGTGVVLRYAVFHWNGSGWALSFGPEEDGSLLGVVALAPDDVWAVGFREDEAGRVETLALHWDGVGWSTVPTLSEGAFSVLYRVAAVAPDDVWAVGVAAAGAIGEGRRSTLVQHWDGTSWDVVPSPNAGAGDSALVDIAAPAAKDVWAVGYNDEGTLIEHWDGTTWEVFPSPASDGALQGVAADSGGLVWAVGEDGSAPLVQRFVCEE